ncbi:MAG TPA: bifunctional diaminohydroxyphosphoribosylaminopyrimidine deaminase/5-amino-6-(5-phosphoribosylamino)uracil reductase RibD [Gemmataceae bacterium]|nr:bifunctional diaminohydroxyphosphoribosylaminopyrimidine deaminase/5-amino-6-(5-phosphoribosylamino)uracil reductase RibD [Gemmataceae bacterium]
MNEQWMGRALELAERGRGHVEPNPLVGAVVVREGRIVGEGWHQRFGEAHAEVHALAAAGAAAAGASLYVTLEPCCHQGQTPPCTAAIIKAGIVRVVAAMADPFPPVAGQGFIALEKAGIRVERGLGENRARRLNAPYLKLLASGRPYVHAKWAMTLDGKIATRTGASQWISNAESRTKVHALRGRMDAIIVGIGTVLTDDPQLTARPPGPRIPYRVVLDSSGRLPENSLLARTAREVPVILVTGSHCPDQRREELRKRGCEILVPVERDHRPAIPALLAELGRRRMTNVMVEGGARVLGSFWDNRAIDEVHVFIAPRLVGGQDAVTPLAGTGAAMLAEGITLADCHIQELATDIYVNGRMPTEDEN